MAYFIDFLPSRPRPSSGPPVAKLPLRRFLLHASLLGALKSLTGASSWTLLLVGACRRGLMRLLPPSLPLQRLFSMYCMWARTPTATGTYRTSHRLASLVVVTVSGWTLCSFKRRATDFLIDRLYSSRNENVFILALGSLNTLDEHLRLL